MKKKPVSRKPSPRRKALWAGGYDAAPGKALAKISLSHPFDRRLAAQDLAGSLAHARGLHRAGLLSKSDLEAIAAGLAKIAAEIADGRFVFEDADEDIHMNVERRLAALAGEAGARLHAGRSRNDQVALDLRLWTVAAIDAAQEGLRALGLALLSRAEAWCKEPVVIPARTHLRAGQPVLLSHALLAYVEMLRRDRDRLADCRRRTAVSPLGSGACAGTTLPLDRRAVAESLGMPEITENSLDAVSDRDFAAEFAFAAALTMVHLSRLAEDLILWTGEEFRTLRLSESTTTGSSMMPQKKNPDALELVRGKSGRASGALISLLTTMKGLPLSYNRDLQETQEPLFSAADTLMDSLAAMTEVVRGLSARKASERLPIESGALSTDLAEELVRRGVPFREAHGRVARWTRRAAKDGADFRAIAATEDPGLARFLRRLTPESSVRARDLPGGTAPARVRGEIRRLRKLFQA
ncbi:MAG TPA: argininosuccinate lyase [Thermoanaerobaculia bacterium]